MTLITGLSPVGNARAAAAAGSVSVTFDKAVTAGSTAALKVFSSQRGGLRSTSSSTASGTTTVCGNTVSFAPTYAFRPGETVQATITTEATTGVAGGNLAAGRVRQFTTAVTGGTGNFTAPATNPEVGVGTQPRSVAVGDVDGDGDLDFLAANRGNSRVSVRLNQN